MINQPTLQKLSDFEDKSLLIVDDDNPFRQRLARAMEKKGFTVTQAESVKIGIETVKSQSPAFADVDLRLSDGNGLEVVKEIQKGNIKSRIIMLTGYGNIPTAVAAIKEGAIDYIAKPAAAEVGSIIHPKALSSMKTPINPDITLAHILFSLLFWLYSNQFTFIPIRC